jgi:hypothetical protein
MANELIKTTSEIAAALGLTEFGKRVIGPSMDEIGERLRGRLKRLFDKAEPMVVNAGITPDAVEAVPLKLLLPILEGASVEEDETLHDMWAALLANAASGEYINKVRPGFVAILKQMAPDEAFLLSRIYDDVQIKVTAENEFRRYGLDLDQLSQGKAIPHAVIKTFADALKVRLKATSDVLLPLDALMAQQLVEKTYWKEEGGGVFTGYNVPPADEAKYTFTLTRRGRAFLDACRPPKPKE